MYGKAASYGWFSVCRLVTSQSPMSHQISEKYCIHAVVLDVARGCTGP